MTVKSMVNMIRRQGGLRTMLSTTGGAQDTLVEEGIGFLTERLAAEVGLRVRTGHRVTAIVQDEAGVTIETTEAEMRASQVIVTVPPPMAKRIRFDPPLPAALTELQETSYMGSVFKAIAVYERPFWRERSGREFIVLDSPGRAIFDSGSPDGPGHLVFLVGGPTARALDDLDPAKRRKILLDDLVPHVGREVLEPAGWHEKSWHLDENAGGGHTALPDPRSPAELPFPHAPVGHIQLGRHRDGPRPPRLSRRSDRGRAAGGWRDRRFALTSRVAEREPRRIDGAVPAHGHEAVLDADAARRLPGTMKRAQSLEGRRVLSSRSPSSRRRGIATGRSSR